MRDPNRVATADLIRAYGQPYEGQVRFFRQLLKEPTPVWGLDIVRDQGGALFDGSLQLNAVDQAIDRRYPKEKYSSANTSNKEVARLIVECAKGSLVQSRRYPPVSPMSLGKTILIMGRCDFYYVENEVPKIVFIQARKTKAPDLDQMKVLAAVMRETLITRDFERRKALVEVLDFGANKHGVRHCRLLSSDQLTPMSADQLNETLRGLEQALQEAVAATDWRNLKAKDDRRREKMDEKRRSRQPPEDPPLL